eukprot:11170829-Alexandrium_andersonii.AAC.1
MPHLCAWPLHLFAPPGLCTGKLVGVRAVACLVSYPCFEGSRGPAVLLTLGEGCEDLCAR